MAAVLVAGALAAAAGCGGSDRAASTGGSRPRADTATKRFAGIPQHVRVLGRPDAPFTLALFVDLQCPFCAAFDRNVLPTVVDRYVRTGKLRLVLRLIAFLGPDSATGAAAAGAAELQNRGWQFVDAAYRRQGRENSGYWTPKFIGALARSVDGLDGKRFVAASGTKRLRRLLEQDARTAKAAGIRATPGFRLGRTGGPLKPPFAGPVDDKTFLDHLEKVVGAASAAQG